MNLITRRILSVFALALLALAAGATEPAADTWNKIHQVLSHPRCSNCHVGAEGVPMWSAVGSNSQARPHGMNIRAGASRMGAENGTLCVACHAQKNAAGPGGPPGARAWLLPPASMAWFGKSSAEICNQIKDPARNGGRTLEKIADHVDHDALVHWGWNPGPGRESAPYSKDETVAFIRAWARAGAPCPTP